MADFFGAQDVDFKALLEMMRGDDDPIFIHQHVMTFQQKISCCEEKQLGDFPLNDYMARLLEILSHTVIMDFQLDTKFSILQSFFFIMDIFPNVIGQLVKDGLITKTASVMEENIQDTMLAGAGVKLFNKISQEMPLEVLESPAIEVLMPVFDFFDMHTQNKILEIAVNVSRHINNEGTFQARAIPILQWIYPMMEMSKFQQDQKRSEQVAATVLNFMQSLNNFYSPSKDFSLFSDNFGKIVDCGLFETVQRILADYAAHTAKPEPIKSDGDQEMEDESVVNNNASNLIDTYAAQQVEGEETKTYSEQTVSQLLQLIQMGCKFSFQLVQTLANGPLFGILTRMLPVEDQDMPAYINDLLSLLNQILPMTKADMQTLEKIIIFGPRQVYPATTEKGSQYLIIKTAIETLEAQKLELYGGMGMDFFQFCAGQLLSKLFFLYRENISQQFREKCISLIDKILAVLPSEVAQDKIDPFALAQLVKQILATGTCKQVLVSLQITMRAFQSNGLKFVVPFQREGASKAILDLAKSTDPQAISRLEKYDQQSNEEQQIHHPFPGSQMLLKGGGGGLYGSLFGRLSETESIEILTMEIEKIKIILGAGESSRAPIPTAQKDMLNIALRDKESQIAKIQEEAKIRKQQIAKQEEELAKKKAEEAKAAAEEGKQESEEQKAEDEPNKKKEEPPKLSQLVRDQSMKLVTDFLDNEDFMNLVRAEQGDQLNLLDKFKQLATQITDEACADVFNCAASQRLIDQLTTFLTSSHGLTTFEFVESGILEALELFLTKAPSQAVLEREAQRSKDKTEEMKHSEELVYDAAQKQARKQISQKEARCLIFRIKVASNLLCMDKQQKFPLRELIQQCHEVISSHESILFEETKEIRNLDATEAIRSLNRQDIIKVVYDPDGSLMEKAHRKDLGLPADDDFSMENETEAAAKIERLIETMEQPAINKAKSAIPFGHLQGGLAAQDNGDAEMEEEKTQVFQKRDRLFKVLGQVSLDVLHAENLWMIEERLKRVDSLQKARDHRVHVQHRAQLRGIVRSPEEANEIADRFSAEAGDDMQEMLHAVGNRIDEILDEAKSHKQFELLQPGFVQEYSEEICQLALELDVPDSTLNLFFDMCHVDMEDRIQEHEEGEAANEDANHEHLRPEHMRGMMAVKIKHFGIMINETRDKVLRMYNERKAQKEGSPDENSPASAKGGEEASVEEADEEEKKEEQSAAQEVEESKEKQVQEEKQATTAMHTKVEYADPPKIEGQVQAAKEIQEESAAAQSDQQKDVTMNDEQKPQEQEQQKPKTEEQEELLILKEAAASSSGKKSRSRLNSNAQISGEDSHVTDALDLGDLITKNNGSDVDIQFYFKGKLLPSNTCFYEIQQQAVKDRKKQLVKPQDMPKFDKNNSASLFKHIMASMHRNEMREADKITIYFRIVEKSPMSQANNARKDSLMDFVNRRERTKSQAADLVSVQQLNSVVQRLIDNEFSVFQQTVDDELKHEGDHEKRQLERALKILKVMNFVVNNTFLLSDTGLNILLSRSEPSRELNDLASRDMDLSIPLASQKDIFHHSKLDANILKQIQDPHKLVSGGLTGILKEIFASCSFLFHYETKLLYFKLVSFLGVDIHRSLSYLKSYQKRKAAGHQIIIPDQQHDRRGGGVNMNELSQKEEVSRDAILTESLAIMDRLEKRKQLAIKFKDEEGIGLGPTYEFFALVAREIQEAGKGKMWRVGSTDGCLFPNPIDPKQLTPQQIKEVQDVFRAAGTYIAKSIVDNKLIDLPISSLMWDLLLGKKLNLFDLRKYDPTQFDFLCQLQRVANRKKEIEEMSCDAETKTRLKEGIRLESSGARVEDIGFYFTLYGSDEIELLRDGSTTELTVENVQEYIDLVLHSLYYECVNLQLQAFKKGFNSVLPLDSIRTFDSRGEIETMVCGSLDDSDWKDLGKLKQAIKADHGYNMESRVYNDFLRFIVELEPSMRPEFAMWLTGSKRLPKGGFAGLDPPISINRVAQSPHLPDVTEKCPSVNTCLHYLKVPEYPSFEILHHKFIQAVEYSREHFTNS